MGLVLTKRVSASDLMIDNQVLQITDHINLSAQTAQERAAILATM